MFHVTFRNNMGSKVRFARHLETIGDMQVTLLYLHTLSIWQSFGQLSGSALLSPCQ